MLYKTKASTLKKVADLHRYQHPGDLVHMMTQPIKMQRLQIDGKLEFEANRYISPAHEKLVKELMPTRTTFRTEPLELRLSTAAREYDIWRGYLEGLVSTLPSVPSIPLSLS
jgi:hypothetical protein